MITIKLSAQHLGYKVEELVAQMPDTPVEEEETV